MVDNYHFLGDYFTLLSQIHFLVYLPHFGPGDASTNYEIFLVDSRPECDILDIYNSWPCDYLSSLWRRCRSVLSNTNLASCDSSHYYMTAECSTHPGQHTRSFVGNIIFAVVDITSDAMSKSMFESPGRRVYCKFRS